MEFVDCIRAGAAFKVDREKAQALLPAGFTIETVAPIADAGLDVIQCESVVLDNQTVAQQFRFATVALAVSVPPGTAGNGTGDSYILELFVNNATIASRMQAAGLAPVVSQIEITETGSAFKVSITDAAGPIYSFDAPASTTAGGTAPSDHDRRLHQATGGRHAWYDYRTIESVKGALAAQIIAPGYVIAQIAITPDPAAYVVLTSISPGSLTFGEKNPIP